MTVESLETSKRIKIATYFKVTEAIHFCRELEAQGLASRYDSTAISGDFYLTMHQPGLEHFVVSIAADDRALAESILGPLDELEDDPRAAGDEAPKRDDAERSRVELAALRKLALWSILVPLLLPLTLYRFGAAFLKPLRPRDLFDLFVAAAAIAISVFLVCLILSKSGLLGL